MTGGTPTRPGSRKPRAPTEQERRLFEEAMADVTRLPRGAPAGTPTPTQPAAPTRQTPAQPPTGRKSQPLPELSPDRAAGLDRKTFDRLRRGRIRPEARLDLHGMTQEAAHRALNDFLIRARRDGKRCVAVVTGKGLFREGGGVLQREVPRWLNEPGLRALILGISHAPPNEGGTGVLHLLLRRRSAG